MVLDVYPILEALLDPNVRLLHIVYFESGIVKVQNKQKYDFIASGKLTLRSLRVQLVSESCTDELPGSIVKRASIMIE